MERTIRVTGKGKFLVTPDLIRLLITQEDTEPVHEDAVRKSTEMKTELNDALEKIGFRKEDLKTLSFNISADYERYHDDKEGWKSRFRGYKFTHRMKLEFSIESNMLGKVIAIVSACTGDPEFTIRYTTSDPETARNKLLAKAVADSKIKAEVLADAAGVELRDIKMIDYSWGQIDIVSTPVDGKIMETCRSVGYGNPGSVDLDIEPDDIEVTDTVTIVWSIE